MTNKEQFKVVLLGDRSTGKTCLMKRYFLGQYNDTEMATIGAAFESKVFTVDGKEYQMGVWDTTGEERYQAICSLYYRGAAAAVICYDVSLQSTFHRLSYWLHELRNVEQSCRIYVCANKRDVLDKYEASPRLSFAESYARENGAKFFLTSSKTGENIDALFDEILEDYISDSRDTPRTSNTIKLPAFRRYRTRRRKKCCTGS